jgi:NAD+ kinase
MKGRIPVYGNRKMRKKLLLKFGDNYLNSSEKRKIIKTIDGLGLEYTEKSDEGQLDAILNFGGDGTVLSSVHAAISNKTPVLCFSRNSSLGFLTPFRIENFEEILALFVQEKLKKHKVTLLNMETGEKPYYSLNEFSIERGDPSRTVTLDVKISNYSSFRVSGDGIIICSSSGSTAYNLSSGGAIIIPDTDVYQITPIACHNPYVGSIIAGKEKSTQISVTTCKGYPLKIYSDGQLIKKIFKGDKVIVKMSNKSVYFLVKEEIDFIKILNKKMFFGGRLNNG